MISVDTNLLFHAIDSSSRQHVAAAAFIAALAQRHDVAISELCLVELYGLLRNPKVLSRPLDGANAVALIEQFRRHPHWRLVGFPDNSAQLHEALWDFASARGFAFRRIYDVRLALALQRHGVREFATCNVKDFAGLGFERVWNPLD